MSTADFSFVVELSRLGEATGMARALAAHALGRARDQDAVPGLLSALERAVADAVDDRAERARLAFESSAGQLEIALSSNGAVRWRTSFQLA